MNLPQLMQAHDRAHARTERFETMPEGVAFESDARRDNEDELASLTVAEDALMERIALALCADDDEFFAKAGFIVRYGDSGDDAEWAAMRLADATRIHIAARSQSPP